MEKKKDEIGNDIAFALGVVYGKLDGIIREWERYRLETSEEASQCAKTYTAL